MSRPDHVAVGCIIRAHGVRGSVLVKPLTDNPNRFRAIDEIMIEKDERTEQYRVIAKTASPKGWILKLDGINTRDEAESMKGAYLLIGPEELPELEEGTYYDFDLVGLEVFTNSGERIGCIIEVEKHPANDVYVVEGDAGKLRLPATHEIVRKVDVKNKRMDIILIDGLEFE